MIFFILTIMNIELTFIDKSYDANNSDIVFFQKNVATNFDELAIAWRVIKNCGRGWSHTFAYPMAFEVGVKDSFNNVSDRKAATNAERWNAVLDNSGNVLIKDTKPAASTTDVEIYNALPKGSIDAQIFKDGKLLAHKTGISPEQKAVFQFKPTLWVGVVSQVEEGEVMNSAILSDINTELSLLGIKRANLIMTGGGRGADAQPFKFTLEPVS